jgi:hypothetical protein
MSQTVALLLDALPLSLPVWLGSLVSTPTPIPVNVATTGLNNHGGIKLSAHLSRVTVPLSIRGCLPKVFQCSCCSYDIIQKNSMGHC